MKSLFMAVVALVFLAGCDDRRCLESHTEIYWTSQYNPATKTSTMQPMYVPVCDKYEEVAE